MDKEKENLIKYFTDLKFRLEQNILIHKEILNELENELQIYQTQLEKLKKS